MTPFFLSVKRDRYCYTKKKIFDRTTHIHVDRNNYGQDYDTRIDRVEKVVECPKLGGLSEVGAPHPKGRAIEWQGRYFDS